MSRPALVLSAVMALGLAGCAQLSNRPAAGTANQTRQQSGPNTPTQTIDPRDASARPAPPRTLPIPGTAPNPTGVAPQGALPDPYANPPR